MLGLLGDLLTSEVMPKARTLYTGTESNLGDRILAEVEKNSFIALPGSCPRKCVPTQEVLVAVLLYFILFCIFFIVVLRLIDGLID